MRFSTIWTLPGLPLKERIDRTLDCWALNVADWLPKRLAFWVAYRQIGHATMKSAHVPATPLDVVLKNIQNRRDGKPIESWEDETWSKETSGVGPV
jgi:polyphosphate kinase 2 (PPK2 family)